MAILELLLLLLLSSVALGWIARRFKFPYPIAQVAGGAALGLVPNLPQYVREVAEFLAMLRGESYERFAAQTTENFKRLFPLAHVKG